MSFEDMTQKEFEWFINRQESYQKERVFRLSCNFEHANGIKLIKINDHVKSFPIYYYDVERRGRNDIEIGYLMQELRHIYAQDLYPGIRVVYKIDGGEDIYL